jgi:MFS family permease
MARATYRSVMDLLAVAPVEPARPAQAAARARRRIATAAIVAALVVAALEGTVVTTAMPTIVRELGGLALYPWVFTAYLLASTVGVLVAGTLADALGRRPVFVVGMALFLGGSAACGLSTSIGALVAFRVLQGLGAGAIQPIAMTIGADLYSLRERARIQALFTSSWGAANVLGPLLGGALVAHVSWRWVFLVNVPVGVVAVALLLFAYRDPPRHHEARPRVELSGALLLGAALSLALVGVEPRAGAALVGRLVALALAAVAGLAFALQQRRTDRPLLAPALLRRPIVRAGLAAALFVGALLNVCVAYVPLWAARASGSAAHAGLALIPLLVGWAFGSSFGVRVLVRHGMRASVGGGFLIALLGATLLAAAVSSSAPAPVVFAALALLGVGLGPAASTSLVAPQSDVPWSARGSMTSVIYATRSLGGSIAVAALGRASVQVQGQGSGLFGAILALAGAAAVVSFVLAPAGGRSGSADAQGARAAQDALPAE